MIEDNYPQFHRNRINLLIHIIMVPVFLLAHVSLITGLLQFDATRVAVSVGFVALSLGLQKLGHGMEATPPQPFADPADFLKRIYREQFSGFWLFVLDGGWLRNWRAAGD